MSFLQEIGWYGLNRLEVWELNEAGEFLSRMSVRKANNQLLIEQYEENPILPDQISPCLPIILALRLENVIETKMAKDEPNVLNQLLGVTLEDKSAFVWQVNPIDEQTQWASVARKQSLQAVWQLLEAFSGHILYFNLSKLSQQILLISPSENTSQAEYTALKERLAVPEAALYPYSVAMQYFRLQGRDLHGWERDLAFAQRLEDNSKWLKRLSLMSAVCLFFLGLGMIVQSQLSQSITQAQGYIQQQAGILQEIDSLNQHIDEHKNYLKQSRSNPTTSQVSYFLDRSAQLAPSQLHFKQWVYAPSQTLCKKLDLDPEQKPLLLIKGTAGNSNSITEFAQALQSKIPRYKVALKHSTYDMQQGQYQFLLTIL
ncbi:MAG: hypothetical protein AAFN10_03115 [Bacteroidota bacterium]